MLHKFSLALPTKQLWRLIQFSNSLVTSVLRGKYYRMNSFLRIVSMDNLFYVSMSIIATRKLLLLGIKSKVHSG